MAENIVTEHTVIDYRIDRTDRIVGVSGTWQDFAVQNGGGKLLNVVGQSLWDHICDKDTQDVYAMLLDAVRASGSHLSFPYRCDSPCVKRFMRLSITAEEDFGIAFRSEVIRIEPLAPEITFDVTSSYKIKQVHVCSNCRKVKVRNQWLEVTDAFETGELTANKNRFLPIYRMCSVCLADMHERSSKLLASASGRMDRLKQTIERYHENQIGGGTLQRVLARPGAPLERSPPPGPTFGKPDPSGR